MANLQYSFEEINKRRIQLFQSEQWTDCSFLVGSEPNQSVIKGHKQILAMASPVFEAMFYGPMAETVEPIHIVDVEPEEFKAFLECVYTGKFSVNSIQIASGMSYLSKKYMLPLLPLDTTSPLCSLTPGNLCRAYEIGVIFEDIDFASKCLELICNNAEKVLLDESFKDVDVKTVITICDQNYLNIDSELILFKALKKYSKSQTSNPTAPHKVANLPTPDSSINSFPTIHNAVQKIRFLTFSMQEFIEIGSKTNMLSLSEKYAILMKICSIAVYGTEEPIPEVPMPEGFTTSRKHRVYDDKGRRLKCQ